MKRIERMKSWYNREYIVIETRRKRLNRIVLGLVYVLGIMMIYWLADMLGLYLILTIFKPFLDQYVWTTLLSIPVGILLIIVLIMIFIGSLIPGLYLLASGDLALDKEFVDDPERTEKWRKKWGKKDD